MRIRAAVCLFSALSAAALGQTLGSIQGNVIDEDGKPVSGVTVRIQPVEIRSGADALMNREVEAAADGGFSFSNVQSGRYRACAQAPGRLWLNPCQWEPDTPAIDLAAGQAYRGLQLRLRQGALVQIRLNDSSRLLPSEEISAAAHLLVGVRTASGLFYPARVVGKEPQGWSFALPVPRVTPLQLSVYARGVQLADEAGTRVLDSGLAVPLSIPAESPGRSFTFNVTGAAQR
jgi:hypothetical protein